jgi:hypothetical protein
VVRSRLRRSTTSASRSISGASSDYSPADSESHSPFVTGGVRGRTVIALPPGRRWSCPGLTDGY